MANSTEQELDLRRGPWTQDEDDLLIHYISSHGEGRWNLLAKSSGLKRRGKSCRLRWLNYLKPDTKRGNLSPQEQLLILELHSKWGNRWSKIAQHLPGRTDNEIKNYWRTRVQKQARQLKIDSNSKSFLEALRQFWMPRLLENSTSPSSYSSISSTETQKCSSLSPEAKQALVTVSSTVTQAQAQERRRDKNLDNFNDKSVSTSVSDHQRSPPSAQEEEGERGNIPCSIAEDCYYVDISNFGMEGSCSSVGIMSQDCHISEADWFNDATFWNMDQLWQFRK